MTVWYGNFPLSPKQAQTNAQKLIKYEYREQIISVSMQYRYLKIKFKWNFDDILIGSVWK